MDLANDDLDLKESGKCILANSFIYGLSMILSNEEACNGCYGLQNKKEQRNSIKKMRKIVI